MKKMLMLLLALALMMSAALAENALPTEILPQTDDAVSMTDAIAAAQGSMAVVPAECLTRAELVRMSDGSVVWVVTMFDVASFYSNGWVITVSSAGDVVNTVTTDMGYFADIYDMWTAEKGPQSLWTLEDKQLYDRLYAIMPIYGMPLESDMSSAEALRRAIEALELTDASGFQIGYGYQMGLGSGDDVLGGVWEVFFVKDGETVYKVNLDAVTGVIYYIEPDEEGNG